MKAARVSAGGAAKPRKKAAGEIGPSGSQYLQAPSALPASWTVFGATRQLQEAAERERKEAAERERAARRAALARKEAAAREEKRLREMVQQRREAAAAEAAAAAPSSSSCPTPPGPTMPPPPPAAPFLSPETAAMVSPGGVPSSTTPRFSPPKLYGDAAELLLTWMKMRCVDGVVPGGAPGIVLTGRAGCGKMTTIRWAMSRLKLPTSALQVFHPWSAESAQAVERQIVLAATAADSAPKVLVLRQAELWALRATAKADVENGPVGRPASSRDCSTFAYWAKLVARVVKGGHGSQLPRVAIILCFPDMSLARTRTMVGRRGEGGVEAAAERAAAQRVAAAAELEQREAERDHGASAAEENQAAHADTFGARAFGTAVASSKSRKRKTPAPSLPRRRELADASPQPWKHINLDDSLLRNVGPLAVRIGKFLGTGSSAHPPPFDGDMRALFRRREDPCRARTPHHLDLNYNIFRASTRLLSDTAVPSAEVRSIVDGDPRLVDMLWSHSATHRDSMQTTAMALDREMWSRLEVGGRLRGDPGWCALEWRWSRRGKVGRLLPLQFQRVPAKGFASGPAKRKAEAQPQENDTAETLLRREYGFVPKKEKTPRPAAAKR